MMKTRETEVPIEKSVLLPLCLPQFLYRLI